MKSKLIVGPPGHPRMTKSRFFLLTGLILAAAGARMVPHPPNFSPIGAMALFGGAYFADRRLAFGVPLAALFLSDLVIGFYDGMAVVYGAFALMVGLGLWLRTRRRPALIAGVATAGAVLFFAVTNFGVWAAGTLYPPTVAGLVACYVAAIPFFPNTLMGDLFYNAVLFGGMALAESKFATLREAVVA